MKELICRKQIEVERRRLVRYRAETLMINPLSRPKEISEGVLRLFAFCERTRKAVQKITVQLSGPTEIEYIIILPSWYLEFRRAFPNW